MFFLFIGYILNETLSSDRIGVLIHGAFADEDSNANHFLYVQLYLLHIQLDDENNSVTSLIEISNDVFQVPIIENINDIDTTARVERPHIFLINTSLSEVDGANLCLQFHSNLPVSLPITLSYDPFPMDQAVGVVYAGIILTCLYIAIIWEFVNRTFAAMFASTMAIAILALMNQRPTTPEILAWIDVETILLLFGMMILVGIFSETGVFDYLAVYAFKVRVILNVTY